MGEVDGVRLLTPDTIASATVEQSDGPDKVLQFPTRFGSGFFIPSMFSPLFGGDSFGHAGAGGSLGMADPVRQIGFGYVMNKMQQNLSGDPRTITLIEAVEASVAGLSRASGITRRPPFLLIDQRSAHNHWSAADG